jgi:hypothetical protein
VLALQYLQVSTRSILSLQQILEGTSVQDLWHFPRPDDAARIVGTLKVGLVSALAIIEPRHRGKKTLPL